MQRESAIVSAYSADRDSGRETRLWWRRLILGVLLAWTIPALLHVIRLDLAVWLLLLVGTGSLLRSGAALLDRLFFAGVILAGGLLTAGLMFSVWPWGLAPVPVGGTLLSLLVVIACLTRRIPRLPLRVGWSDGAIVGSGLATFAAIYHPLLGLSLTHRLTYSTTQLDRLAHFALLQTIGRVSGYAFLHQSEARISVQTPTEYVYPQGSHFLLAAIDAFSRLSGSPVGNYDRYFVYVLVAFAMLVACIVWAARWIADRVWVKDGGSLSVVPQPPSRFSAYYPACSDRGSTRRCSAWCSWLSRPRSWSVRFDRYGNSLWWFPPWRSRRSTPTTSLV